jgi:hypothetical protein
LFAEDSNGSGEFLHGAAARGAARARRRLAARRDKIPGDKTVFSFEFSAFSPGGKPTAGEPGTENRRLKTVP